MPSLPDPSILAVLLLSAFVHGVFGFGFPLVATPLLTMLLGLREAILLTLIPTLCINVVSILGERNRLEALRRYWPVPAFTIVGSLTGTQLLLRVDTELFRLLLALVLIAYLLADLLHESERTRRVPKWGLALLGLCLGLLAGVVNIFAPIIVAFALYTRMPADLMVAVFNMSFFSSKSGQLLGFIAADALDSELLIQASVALPLVIAVLWVGIRLRRRLHPQRYLGLLRMGLWVMALALLWDALSAVPGAWTDSSPLPSEVGTRNRDDYTHGP